MTSPKSPGPATAFLVQPSSPRFPPSGGSPTAGANRKIGIAVDLSNESAFAVRWAVHNYLRPGDAVVLLHVSPTDILYGADWGAMGDSVADDEESQRKLESDYDAFTTAKANDIAQPLAKAQIPYKIHIVKDHDMKERLCLEVERLGLSAVIMGSRGFGAFRRSSKGRLGSVSDYCVRHCVCPVVVVRFSDGDGDGDVKPGKSEFPVVHEDEPEYHNAVDKWKKRELLQWIGKMPMMGVLDRSLLNLVSDYLTSFGSFFRKLNMVGCSIYEFGGVNYVVGKSLGLCDMK